MTSKTIAPLHRAIVWLVMRLPASLANRLIRWRFPAVEQHSPGALLFADNRATHPFIDVRGLTIRHVRDLIATHRRQNPNARVALVCDIGYCSSKFADALGSAGCKNVVNLEGGLRALRDFHHQVRHYAAQRTA